MARGRSSFGRDETKFRASDGFRCAAWHSLTSGSSTTSIARWRRIRQRSASRGVAPITRRGAGRTGARRRRIAGQTETGLMIASGWAMRATGCRMRSARRMPHRTRCGSGVREDQRPARGSHPLAAGALLLLSLSVSRPLLGQDAATIRVSAEIVEVPVLGPWLRELPAWLGQVGIGASRWPGDRRITLGGGLVALVAETIEPDRVRVRLEYIGN
jgi:hypothetical protein